MVNGSGVSICLAWDSRVKDVTLCVNGRKKLNQLHSVLSNRDVTLCVRRLLLYNILPVVRPNIEYLYTIYIVLW